ncbi:MAG TPA: CPBP family intramembrane glutamic endopeptidase [Kofleriaceae bacterium]
MRLTTGNSVAIVVACSVAACVNPQVPIVDHPPAPDRFARAASQDPQARASAADELVGDPTFSAVQMLNTLLVRDIDPAVRAHAADAIAARHDPDLEGMLENAAHADPDPRVRQAAEQARQRLWPWGKSPGKAAALSIIGLGQFYLRDNQAGTAYLLTTGALVGSGLALVANHDVSIDGPSDSAKVPLGLGLATAGQNLLFYGIFDSYRDARVLRGDAGYSFHITHESLDELALAPFNPSVLKSPWVWGGVPAALAFGLGASILIDKIDGSDTQGRPTIFDVKKVNVFGHKFNRGAGFAAGAGYFGALFGTVGVGEESLFRGVIQTEMEERFGTVPGLVLGSVIFGSVHTLNFVDDPKQALYAVPVITVVGTTLGLAYQHTGHQLKTGVAMHFWYDTLLSLAAFAIDPDHQPFVVNYSMP